MDDGGFKGTFSTAQTKQLLAPIKVTRVLNDGRGHSHVSQQDITAHLIRVFGFGNFCTEIVDLQCIFATPRAAGDAVITHTTRWDVAYRCTMRLTVFDEKHNPVAYYEDASVGDAQNQNQQDGHDLAMKSAISLAKKRCTINLGDQFGLSLYNKGQTEALVRGTHVMPKEMREEIVAAHEAGTKVEARDVQEGVPQQVSMGVDEVEKEAGDPEPTEEQKKLLADSLGATEVVESPATEEQA